MARSTQWKESPRALLLDVVLAGALISIFSTGTAGAFDLRDLTSCTGGGEAKHFVCSKLKSAGSAIKEARDKGEVMIREGIAQTIRSSRSGSDSDD